MALVLPPAKLFELKMAEELVIEETVDHVSAYSTEGNLNIDEGLFSNETLIALKPTDGNDSDDIRLEISEEVIDESFTDVPHIAQEQEIPASESSSPKLNSKKRKPKNQKSKILKKFKGVGEEDGSCEIDVPRKWERKKVQIKTLEGEFSVTVWATGVKYLIVLFSNIHIHNLKSYFKLMTKQGR